MRNAEASCGRLVSLTFFAPARRTISTIWLMVVPRTMESSIRRTLLPCSRASGVQR